MGLPVTVGVPELERVLMALYPQPRGRTPAVASLPGPAAPTLPPRRELPRGHRQRSRAGGITTTMVGSDERQRHPAGARPPPAAQPAVGFHRGGDQEVQRRPGGAAG